MKKVINRFGIDSRARQSGWIQRRFLVVLGVFAIAAAAYAAAPTWWSARGVMNGRPSNDYAVANQGQLKHMAKAARAELVAQGHLQLTDIHAINTLVDGWSANFDRAQDYAPVNLGQLKAVAKPFYDALYLDYPWSASSAQANDYAVANIGQLKSVFAFNVSGFDTDSDGLPDGWETKMFGDLSRGPAQDSDGDGLSNLVEWQEGTHPNNALSDDDLDGMLSVWEFQNQLQPLNPADAGPATGRIEGPIVPQPPNIANYAQPDGSTDYDGYNTALEIYNADVAAFSTRQAAYLLQDPDQDGLSNLREFKAATHPRMASSDADIYSDYEEVTYGGDPLVTASIPPVRTVISPDGESRIRVATFRAEHVAGGETVTLEGSADTLFLPLGATVPTRGRLSVATDVTHGFATVYVFAPSGANGSQPITLGTGGHLADPCTLVALEWFGSLTATLNHGAPPAPGGPSPQSTPPPEGLVFTAYRAKSLVFRAKQSVSPEVRQTSSGSMETQWFKAGQAPTPPQYGDDGFNGDGDLAGDNEDAGDPRDEVGLPGAAEVPASPEEDGAYEVTKHTGGAWEVIGPYGAPGPLAGSYVSSNAYSPPDKSAEGGVGGFDHAKALRTLGQVSFFRGGSNNGWMGNGPDGVKGHTVTSSLTEGTEQAPLITYQDPETGETVQTTATTAFQHASMEQKEVRLQTNKDVEPGKPLSAVFVLAKTTVEGANTSGEFVATLKLTINSGKTSDACEVLTGTLPSEVTKQGGVVSMRSPAPVAGKISSYRLEPSGFLPDWNRDGKIDDEDRGEVSTEKPWRFWVNDDNDDNETEGDDIPNPTAVNGYDGHVNKLRDLNDFFPVWLDISELLKAMPASEHDYVIESDTNALQFIETDLEPANVKKFLTGALGSPSIMDNPNAIALHSSIKPVYQQQGKLSQDFLSKAKTGDKGVLLFEAFKVTEDSLKLVVRKKAGGGVMAERAMPLNIQSVEKMYRHVNLLEATEQSGGRPTEVGEPANMPDDYCNDKNLVFVHGYNVNPQQARGWAAETFKRLWWSGSKAKYTAVTWHGAESQLFGIASPNYHVNVEHAFATAEALAEALSSLEGEKMLVAHSLGNMVVSSAISDWGAVVDKYVAIDAAVPIEAWDGGAAKSTDMVHLEWYASQDCPERLWSTEWHALWPTQDGRSKLTWRDRFDQLSATQIYNFYSSGEEVLETHPLDYHPDVRDIAFKGVGRYAWALQEKLKGRMVLNSVLGSTQCGWGFNNEYQPRSIGPSLTDDQIRSKPFFRISTLGYKVNISFPPSNITSLVYSDPPVTVDQTVVNEVDPRLFTSEGSAYASENKDMLLARAFPSRTLPIGANEVLDLDPGSNFDMNQQFKNGWPQSRSDDNNWKHSDMRVIAYTYIHKMFDKIVALGGLSE